MRELLFTLVLTTTFSLNAQYYQDPNKIFNANWNLRDPDTVGQFELPNPDNTPGVDENGDWQGKYQNGTQNFFYQQLSPNHYTE